MKLARKPQNGPTWRAVLPYIKQGLVVAGIDEVGRGAWAGPVVAAAVVLPRRPVIAGLADSKVLSPTRRAILNQLIRRHALAIGLGWVAAAEVDTHGLTWAVRESGLRALAGLGVVADMIILDGRHNYLAATHQAQAIVRADATVVPVAAASIVAKVARDSLMTVLSRRLPGYGFEQHVGYGTALHRAALDSLGPSPIHRLSYAPLQGFRP